jgi:hypothetical protein
MRAHRSERDRDGSVIADQRECVNNVRTKASAHARGGRASDLGSGEKNDRFRRK